MAQGTGLFNGPSTDVLGQGITEADNGAFNFPADTSVNSDSVKIGNDQALAFGAPWSHGGVIPNAQNNLEIKKNQQSDGDRNTLINAEFINIGNRQAMAFGAAAATNNIKIVTNQMGKPGEEHRNQDGSVDYTS
jgi:hypothetical protein